MKEISASHGSSWFSGALKKENQICPAFSPLFSGPQCLSSWYHRLHLTSYYWAALASPGGFVGEQESRGIFVNEWKAPRRILKPAQEWSQEPGIADHPIPLSPCSTSLWKRHIQKSSAKHDWARQELPKTRKSSLLFPQPKLLFFRPRNGWFSRNQLVDTREVNNPHPIPSPVESYPDSTYALDFKNNNKIKSESPRKAKGPSLWENPLRPLCSPFPLGERRQELSDRNFRDPEVRKATTSFKLQIKKWVRDFTLI